MDTPARLRRLLAAIVVMVAGAALAVALVPRLVEVSGPAGPGTVTLSARAAREGRTTVEVPPLGEVSAPTHGSPLAVSLRLDGVQLDGVEALLDSGGAGLRDDVEPDLVALGREWALKALVAATVVGAAAGLMWPRRQRRARANVAFAASGALLAVGGLVASTVAGFSADAFSTRARYVGTLEHAPSFFANVKGKVEGFGSVRERISALSDNIEHLYAQAGTARVAGSRGDTVILHVSDIHLNPLGLEVAAQLAERFEVDAILDTGDLTSFGYAQEASFGQLVQAVARRTGVPYLVVPGNHDSPSNRAALEGLEGVRVLDGDVAQIGDLRILGMADPRFTADNALTKDERRELIAAQQPEVATLVLRTSPDLLAVHDPAQAEAAWGLVPTVAAGHRHEFQLEEHEGTVLAVSGSTGATGVGSFLTEDGAPYRAQLLRFSGGRLVALDRVELQGVDGGFRIERHLLGTSSSPAAGVAGHAEGDERDTGDGADDGGERGDEGGLPVVAAAGVPGG